MGWFANRRARAARETGVEASGAFCRAAGRDERGPDVAAPAAGGSSAPQRNDVRGLTRLACGAIALLTLSGVLAMEGCAAVSTDAENSAASEQAAAASASDVEYASFEEVAAAFDESALDLDYSKRDLDASYDASSATVITLSGDSASVQGAGAQTSAAGVVISSAGTYIVSGELTDGQLMVDAGDDDKVQLVLAGATIHNEDGPAIYVRNADKCFVTLDAGTENSLSDGSSYTLEDDSDEPYATLFSRCDLTLNGSGTLTVDGGIVNVASCNEGYEAEKVYVNGGDTHIVASDDGVNASAADLSDDADADAVSSTLPNGGTPGASGKGGGAATPDAGGRAPAGARQGGQAPGAAAQQGGQAPGAAGVQQGGQAPDAAGAQQGGSAPELPAGDNAGGAGGATDPGQQGGDPVAGAGVGQADSSCLIQINGGYLVVDSVGDAIDSNGNVEVTGGVLLVSGPTSDGDGAFDYDGSATISGGTVLMVGSTGMAQSFTGGTQAFAMTSASGEAGESVCVVDGSGNVVVSLTATKRFDMVLASSPAFTEGGEYTLVIGGEVANANADGYTDSSTVSGGSEATFAASCTASAGMGGAGGPGAAGGK